MLHPGRPVKDLLSIERTAAKALAARVIDRSVSAARSERRKNVPLIKLFPGVRMLGSKLSTGRPPMLMAATWVATTARNENLKKREVDAIMVMSRLGEAGKAKVIGRECG